MEGYIRFDDHRVEFGFAVPLPSLPADGRVLFDVSEVGGFAQRCEPDPGSVIGRSKNTLGFFNGWTDLHPGVQYEQVGIYLGQGQVLTARLEGM